MTIIEILSRQAPYPDKNAVEVFTSVSKGGFESLVDWNEGWATEKMKSFLMGSCFVFDPNQRSTFKVIFK